MGEQLELTVNHTCDKCKKSKPRAFSYFCSRMWFCKDCSEPNTNLKTQELQCKSFDDLIDDLIATRRQYYNEISKKD